MAWSIFSRLQASERFWKPIDEQVGILIRLVEYGEATADDIYYNTSDFIDSTIFGNRWNSPIFRNALRMVLRQNHAQFKICA